MDKKKLFASLAVIAGAIVLVFVCSRLFADNTIKPPSELIPPPAFDFAGWIPMMDLPEADFEEHNVTEFAPNPTMALEWSKTRAVTREGFEYKEGLIVGTKQYIYSRSPGSARIGMNNVSLGKFESGVVEWSGDISGDIAYNANVSGFEKFKATFAVAYWDGVSGAAPNGEARIFLDDKLVYEKAFDAYTMDDFVDIDLRGADDIRIEATGLNLLVCNPFFRQNIQYAPNFDLPGWLNIHDVPGSDLAEENLLEIPRENRISKSGIIYMDSLVVGYEEYVVFSVGYSIAEDGNISDPDINEVLSEKKGSLVYSADVAAFDRFQAVFAVVAYYSPLAPKPYGEAKIFVDDIMVYNEAFDIHSGDDQVEIDLEEADNIRIEASGLYLLVCDAFFRLSEYENYSGSGSWA